MKTAKTNKKLISILCAIFSVVFAFIIGTTFASSSFTFDYGTNNKSTTAYMANNQHTLINDTTLYPVSFGKGSHNFEIALKYAIDYEFDFRIDYSLQWKNSAGTNVNISTENVILNFANRDNLIVDESHIYYVAHTDGEVSGVQAGDGKITVISGVNYIDPEDIEYYGLYLTVNASVTISPKTETYTSEHALVKNISSSESAKAWLQYKNCKNGSVWQTTENGSPVTKDAYIMLYNYRRDYNHGVPFPGARTAHNKTYESDNQTVKTAKWLGGNRAYAGTGMYIITGAQAVQLKVKVQGIWREKEDSTGMYENSILFNYTNKWHSLGVDGTNYIHNTCAYIYTIPAYSTCYVDILDSVEVISAGADTSNVYDSHRAIIHQIVINDSIITSNGNHIQSFMIKNPENLNYLNKEGSYSPITYTKDDITIVNESKYLNNLYEVSSLGGTNQLSYYTNVTLINNTSSEKQVSISYKLTYRVSNGDTGVYDINADKTFGGGKYFTLTDSINNNFEINSAKTSVIIAPYSSVCVCDVFDVMSGFNDVIKTACGGVYDAWVQLTPTVSNTTTISNGLELESTYEGSNLVVRVKNNSNNVLSGITVSNLKVQQFNINTLKTANNGTNITNAYTQVVSQPLDWKSSFWKYYEQILGKMVPVAKYTEFSNGIYYSIKDTIDYNSVSVTPNSLSGVKLNPGDSYVILTYSNTTYTQFVVTGNVTATTKEQPAEPILVNNGTSQAYIENTSETKSYFVRIKGSTTSTDFNNSFGDGYSYYIGVLRPKQILNIPLSSAAVLDAVETSTTFNGIDWQVDEDNVEAKEAAVKEIEKLFA